MSGKNITPQEILLIGDSQEDQKAAKSSGCHFVGIKSSRKLNIHTNPVYPNFVKIKEYLDRCYVL